MKHTVSIMGKSVERIEYKGQPVITFRMFDELHERPKGTAKRNFSEHKSQLIENEDFFKVSYKEWSEIPSVRFSYQSKTYLIFLTASGYLMLVKSFTDDRAWLIQRALVRSYFVVREFVHSEKQYEHSLLETANHLLGIVCHELEQVREERNDLRQELTSLREQLVAKGATHSRPEPPAHAVFFTRKDEILNRFLSVWWNEYKDGNVGVSHLYPLVEKYDIPLGLGNGSRRSRCISLGRKLTKLCDQKFGNYLITEVKKFRNVKRYKLQLC